jgi:hypothetical protein
LVNIINSVIICLLLPAYNQLIFKMENTNSNILNGEAPLIKKKWQTPQLVIISPGDIKGGMEMSPREGSFIPTVNGQFTFNGGGPYSSTLRNYFAS